MLSFNDFCDLKYLSIGCSATPEEYNYYLVREHMLEDYLDIFRGKDTRAARMLAHPVVMPYNNPFFTSNGQLIAKNCGGNYNIFKIKYLLIGEAAPPFNEREIDHKGDDKVNSFFYSKIDIQPTGYFDEPIKAFGIGASLDKAHKLLHLAEKGFLLIDILPFALSYSTPLRKKLVAANLHGFYHDTACAYSVFTRLNNLHNEGIINKSNLECALIAPPTISCHIANLTSRTTGMRYAMPHPFLLDLNHNRFGLSGATLLSGSTVNGATHRHYFFKWPSGDLLNGIYPTHAHPDKPLSMAPKYCCCAYGTVMTVPHYIFIKNALHL